MDDARLDHVAIAVPHIDTQVARWVEPLGARLSMIYPNLDRPFIAQQHRFANGAKLELIAPNPAYQGEDDFIGRFLTRFGSQVHHLTLKVPDLEPALIHLEAAGIDPVGVDRSEAPTWQEAFLPPRIVGGLVVQIASSDLSDDAWASQVNGFTPRRCPPDAARLTELVLGHPDLASGAQLWRTLGARVDERSSDELMLGWPTSPLRLRIEQGDPGVRRLLVAATNGAQLDDLPPQVEVAPQP